MNWANSTHDETAHLPIPFLPSHRMEKQGHRRDSRKVSGLHGSTHLELGPPHRQALCRGSWHHGVVHDEEGLVLLPTGHPVSRHGRDSGGSESQELTYRADGGTVPHESALLAHHYSGRDTQSQSRLEEGVLLHCPWSKRAGTADGVRLPYPHAEHHQAAHPDGQRGGVHS